ncbi:MAG: M14 family zinc carboxypeptidase [Gemmatimonadota bacterium]|nr:M14 family zinc carboxypeptidase [Gemmatimonadota bacterium]
MNSERPPAATILAILLAAFCVSQDASSLAAQAADVPSPEVYFGHQMGADRKLARWDRLVEYYELLGEASDRLEVVNMGETTLGNPFIAMYFTSSDNHARLDEIKQLNALLSDPRGASEGQIQNAIENGRAVIVQSLCLHSTEVASSQTGAELAYDMVTRTDEEMVRIMDETVGIMFPCMNPDGEIIVTDWYNETVGTEYEGVGPPSLYHHYIGHDNNRDAFMQNTVESQYVAEIMFREWIPQAYVDHHQMGAYTARIYLPPYAEPVRPEADPLVWREMSWYGAHQAYKMEEADLEGAVNAAIYSGWGHFGFHWITPFHNIAGMLTESASAQLATPLFVHPEQLRGSRQLPEYEEQTTFPNPWEGGWWTVRDIVERQKVAFLATLDIAARNRETVLRNAYLKAIRQTERGLEGGTKAFIIPADQHDVLTMHHMVNKLLLQGIEVRRVDGPFAHEGRLYPAGSFVVTMGQPKRGLIRWLLGQTYYPDNSYTRDRDGDPIRPYDMSTDNIAEFMGVRVDAVSTGVSASARVVEGLLTPAGTADAGEFGYWVDGRQNAAFRALNLLWNEGVEVSRSARVGGNLRAGDFVVAASTSPDVVARVAAETGVTFRALDSDPGAGSIRRQRVAMYQRYFGGNMDEGWTRWLLEDFEFPYTSVFDARILEGDLIDDFDVLILPADGVNRMTGDTSGGDGGGFGPPPANRYPPEYRSGFGQAGVDAIRAFVEAGGTLVTFAEAGDFAIEKLGLPVRNAVAGLPSREFWSPGSTLKVRVDNENRFAFGMPERALAAFLARNQVYEVTPGARNHTVTRVVEFIDRDILRSGWLLGEDHIADKATMVTADLGEGTVVLIGFRAQHRAQTHGTFKLVFNALVSAPEGDGVAAGGEGR